PSKFLLCASGRKTFQSWSNTSSTVSRRRPARKYGISRRKPWNYCSLIHGQEIFANCKTLSNDRSFFVTQKRSQWIQVGFPGNLPLLSRTVGKSGDLSPKRRK